MNLLLLAGGPRSETAEQVIRRVALGWWSARTITTLWQDAARTTQVASDGDVIHVADSRVGSFNFVAVSASNRATYKTNQVNGHPAIRCGDGATVTVLIATTGAVTRPFYWLFIGKAHGYTGFPFILSAPGVESGGTYTGIRGGDNKFRLRDSTADLDESGTNFTVGDVRYIEAKFDGTGSSIRINDTTTSGTGGTPITTSVFNYGSSTIYSNPGDFDATDIVLLPATVSNADLAIIRTHLKTTIGGLA